MWKFLQSYSESERQYQFIGKLIPIFACLALGLIGTGWINGLAFAPSDYQQGNAFRIMYAHVPAAIFSMVIYALMAVMALIGMVWQIRNAFLAMRAMAVVGAGFTFIALVTGSIWGKPTWGTYWVWDARLTSELILLFLYIGVISLFDVFKNPTTSAKTAGILSIVGVINLPIIHFSVQWWNTLHQASSITRLAKPAIATSMLIPLIMCIWGYFCLFIWLSLSRYRVELIKANQSQSWVQNLVKSAN